MPRGREQIVWQVGPAGAEGRQHLTIELLQGGYFRVGPISANRVCSVGPGRPGTQLPTGQV
jgi:hypothetical protein